MENLIPSRMERGVAMPRAIRATLLLVLSQCAGCSHEEAANPNAVDLEPKSSAGYANQLEIKDARAGDERPDINAETRAVGQQSLEPPNSIYLATETRFIEHGGLSRVRADEVLESRERFSRALDEMSSDAAKSMEAQDQAAHYRSALTQAVGADGAVASFSCGLSMCMGTVQTRKEVDNEQWTLRFLEADSTRVFGHMSAMEQVGNLHESRFIFSTDPNLPGIVVPIND